MVSAGAMAQALKNLEEHFAFVGLTEEWEACVALMEKLFPTYFEV